LQDQSTNADLMLFEKMDSLKSDLVFLSEQHKDLQLLLKEMTVRVSNVQYDVREVSSAKTSRKDISALSWYYDLYNNNDRTSQPGPQIANSRGDNSSEKNSSDQNSVHHASTEENRRSGDTSRRDSTTLLLDETVPVEESEKWEKWNAAGTADDPDQTKLNDQRLKWLQWDYDGWTSNAAEEGVTWETWNITLYKTAEVPSLGADIHDDADGTIVFHTILQEGLLRQYNQWHPNARISAGDRLSAVNGKSDPSEMRKECHKKMKLDLTILHRIPKRNLQ